MKKSSSALSVGVVIILGIFTLLSACISGTDKVKPDVMEDKLKFTQDIIWHIKAIHPEGRTIDVKALDKDGTIYDVKAIQDADQQHLLDIKALVGEQKLPVKILVSEDEYAPVKAIGEDGTIYDIKAITPEGDKLDVKGVSSSGNIIHIKAINKAGAFYGIKAMSREGQLNDVKGVKMSKDILESTVYGVKVRAHVKALPQTN